MKKLFALLLLTAILTLPLPAFAVPALDRPITITQNDGSSVKLTQRGDEFSHWFEDSKGNAVVRTEKGAYEFAKPDGEGGLKASGVKYSTKTPPPTGTVQNFKPAKNSMQIFNENRIKNQSLISRALSALNEIVEGWHSRPVSGDKKLMVVRVNFVNMPLAGSEDFHRQVIWEEGENALSVHQYYKDQSHGTLNIVSADYDGSTGSPFGLITISLDASCYNGGKHPDRLLSSNGNTEEALLIRHANEVAMLTSVVKKISEDLKVDFTKFDTNSDDRIDQSELCLYLVVAGYEEAFGGYIDSKHPAVWAHAWSSFSSETVPSASHDLKISGKTITDWAMNGECGYDKTSPKKPIILPFRGTMTHELGHQMCKLPDLYDVSGGNNGLDMYSLMGAGNWGALSGDIPGSRPVNLDAWSRLYLGWATNPNTITISKNTRQNVTFKTALTQEEGGIVKITPHSFPSSEYLLAEVRDPKNSKWDQGLQGGSIYDESKTGAVLLLHVDENVGSGALEYGNNFNSSAQPHQGVIPIAPNCYFRVSSANNFNSLWFKGNPYLDEVSKDIAAFSAGRTYFYGGSGAYNAGVRSGIALENISDSGKEMSADITYAEGTGTYPAHPLTPILDRDMAPALDILLPNTIFTVEKAFKLLKDISSEDIALDDAHQTILTDEAIRRASGTKGSIHSLPIFELISQTDMPLINMVGSFTVASADLMAKTAGEVKLLVVTGKETAKYLTYTNDKYDFVRDGYFTIQPNDKSTSMLSKNAALTDNYYRITIFAKDNGSCDMDPLIGSAVLVPAAVQETETSGGGCSAGFTAITLIFALGLIPLARNKHR